MQINISVRNVPHLEFKRLLACSFFFYSVDSVMHIYKTEIYRCIFISTNIDPQQDLNILKCFGFGVLGKDYKL